MKFEHALPALRAGYVIGIHYPDDIVFTWYSKCKVHPRDVYVHSFSRPKDLIGQFPSADVLRDDWIVGVEVYPEPVEGVWSNNIPLWFAIEGEPTIEELKEKAEAALAAREERLQG
jgi:hypothetical protein